MMGIGLIPIVLLIGAVAYALGWRPQFTQMTSAQTKQTPLDALKERYARGDIGRDEFEQIRRDLDDPAAPAGGNAQVLRRSSSPLAVSSPCAM